MLERLTVSNLVLIRDAELELGPGLTVVTGETGAGKTILLGALGLILGARADGGVVGPTGGEAYVEASFAVGPGDLDDEAFDGVREVLPDDEDVLTLARRVTAAGRGRALAAGRATTREALERAGERHVGVVSQHEARALARPAVQRTLLDGFLGDAHAARLQAMADAWRTLGQARRELAALEEEARDADRLTADLADLVQRVEAVDPTPGEDVELRSERDRLRHVDALLAAAAEAAALLNPDDGDGAQALTARAERALQPVEHIDERLAATAEELRDAAVRLEEAAHTLHAYASGLEHDPARLDAVEARLERLDDLARRHGTTEAALAAAAAASERLDRLGRRDEERAAAEARARAALTAALVVADELGRARREGATRLATAVERHLADLGMADARVVVTVEPRDLGPTGADDVQLLVAPNPGLEPASVARTASGGELSRIALAIRLAAHEGSSVRTLVFDEVDAGVGGRTARAVGDKLAELSRRTQVLCITHLPQIAARADRHFQVVKERGDPTVTRIERLEGDDVDQELARMLGAEVGSEEALRLARSLRAGA